MRQTGPWRVLAAALTTLWLFTPDTEMRAQNARTAAQEPSREARLVHAWLDTYEQQGEAAAQALLPTVSSVAPLATQLIAHGRAWVDASTPERRDHRRLVAATAALDILRAGLENEWYALLPLMEWGCQLVRQLPRGTTGERFWQLSVLALHGGAKDFNSTSLGNEEKGHLSDHVLPRLGNEPRLRLMIVEAVRRAARPRGTPSARNFARPPDPPFAWFRIKENEVHDRYRDLYADPEVGDEARVRHIAYFFDLRDAAGMAPALEQARARIHDPFLRYVVLFLSGRFHEFQGRDSEALPYYREASALVPYGVSAALATAEQLFIAGESEAAEAILTRAVRSVERDPWHLFQLNDYRFYDEWRRGLSEARR